MKSNGASCACNCENRKMRCKNHLPSIKTTEGSRNKANIQRILQVAIKTTICQRVISYERPRQQQWLLWIQYYVSWERSDVFISKDRLYMMKTGKMHKDTNSVRHIPHLKLEELLSFTSDLTRQQIKTLLRQWINDFCAQQKLRWVTSNAHN